MKGDSSAFILTKKKKKSTPIIPSHPNRSHSAYEKEHDGWCWDGRQRGVNVGRRRVVDTVGYISCDSVKINNNKKKSVIVNKQQKLTVNTVWIDQV